MQDKEMPASGITRREALRKGTLAGLGMVWVTPAVTSIEMTPALAQATSGPKTDTTLPRGDTSTSNGGSSPTSNAGSTPTSSDVGNSSTSIDDKSTSTSAGVQASSTAGGATSSSGAVGSQTTAGPTAGPTAAPKDEVLAGDLPFTGLPLEQLLPLAGGAVATGAAIVRAARNKDAADSDSD